MLKIKVSCDLPNMVICLEGELNLSTNYILSDAVNKLDVGKTTSLTFCINELRFIDCTGLSQLITYYKDFSKYNIPVQIHNENYEIEEILSLLGIREILNS